MLNVKSISIAVTILLTIALAWIWYQLDNKPLEVTLQPDNQGLVQSGKQVYADNCATCHGKSLEGQTNWQTRTPEGKLPAPPHDQHGHTWHHKDQLLFDLTKFGLAAVTGSDYETDMPVYKDILSDQEIIAVLSYIKRKWPAEVREMHDKLNRDALNK
jgi:S-disulfanyl-L-cysteine oxidoreductase SoxD